jgi:adenylyltransferase/sulfurtransferase
MSQPDNTGRYARQQRVAGIGPDGQQRLQQARVLIVGIGALGTHSADALCRAGVGELWLCDRDVVELSNLQRQVLFTEADAAAGTPKAVAAREHLQRVNTGCRVQAFVQHCNRAFLQGLPHKPDLILDGTDNFPTRYLINDYAMQQGIPWIYAGAVAAEGAAMAVLPGRTACLRCLWPEAPPAASVGTCETAGILQPAVAAVVAFQTAEAIKLLCGRADEVARGVFTCDVWRASFGVYGQASGPSPECATCRGERWPALEEQEVGPVTLCGRDAVQVEPQGGRTIDLEQLARSLQGHVQALERTPHLLRFEASGCRFSVFPGGRALLFGVHDPLRARALYDRWLG